MLARTIGACCTRVASTDMGREACGSAQAVRECRFGRPDSEKVRACVFGGMGVDMYDVGGL